MSVRWIRSSSSGSGGSTNCVEVAANSSNVLLRDSKDPSRTLHLKRSAWIVFARGLASQ
ncbi:DUF397 domain-containing protein [Amycolatopsis sp. cmx-4-61]|uniref:DUF397 domain-containing protein n=1 Tax=Amycolatopsis sp. cmx-4-61 TaxID=2790937 RepID=UPI0039791470